MAKHDDEKKVWSTTLEEKNGEALFCPTVSYKTARESTLLALLIIFFLSRLCASHHFESVVASMFCTSLIFCLRASCSAFNYSFSQHHPSQPSQITGGKNSPAQTSFSSPPTPAPSPAAAPPVFDSAPALQYSSA